MQAYQLACITFIFLAVAASRLIHLPGPSPDIDEVWSIWQTFGTPSQVIQWTPYDWPPLYYLLLGGWKELAGISPFVLRYFSLLAFLPGAASLYRAARKMFGADAGMPVVISFAALGYNLFLSVIIRGYGFMLALTPLMLWLTINFFERPTLKRAIWLGLCMTVMFYIHATSILVFVVLGVYTLIVYRQRIYRWWLPIMITALLAIPEIVTKANLAVQRLNVTLQLQLQPLGASIRDVFTSYAGYAPPLLLLWAILLALATFRIIQRGSVRPAQSIAVAAWMLMIVGVYFLNPILGFFVLRYLWWGGIGFTVWIGWGITQFPSPVRFIAMLLLIIAMFAPIPTQYGIPGVELNEPFAWLANHIHNGDVIVLAPNLKIAPEQWDYYMRAFLPQQPLFVAQPGNYRHVWYADDPGKPDFETLIAVSQGRMPGEYVATAGLRFQRYEAPPNSVGRSLKDGYWFYGTDVINAAIPGRPVFRPSEWIGLRTWWKADDSLKPRPLFNLYLSTPKGMIPMTQSDPSSQAEGPHQALTHTAGFVYSEDLQGLIPQDIPTGQYWIIFSDEDPPTIAQLRKQELPEDQFLRIALIDVVSR